MTIKEIQQQIRDIQDHKHPVSHAEMLDWFAELAEKINMLRNVVLEIRSREGLGYPLLSEGMQEKLEQL